MIGVSHRYATHCAAAPRITPQHNEPNSRVTLHNTALRCATPLDATSLFNFVRPRFASLRNATRRLTARLNTTQRTHSFCVSRRYSTQRDATHLSTPPLCTPQRTHFTALSRHPAARRGASSHNTRQHNVPIQSSRCGATCRNAPRHNATQRKDF